MSPEERLQQLFDAERGVEANGDARERIRQRLMQTSSLEVKPALVRSGPLQLGRSLRTKLALVVFGSAAAAAAVWGVDSAQHYGKTSELVRPMPSMSTRPATSGVSRRLARPEPPRMPDAVTDTSDSDSSVPSQPRSPPPPHAPTQPAPSASTGPQDPSFDEELSLLKAAKSELNAGRPHLAMVWLDEHAHRFPRGVFAVEREGLQILIACSGPDTNAGQERARTFRARYPNSPLVDRVWRRCFPLNPSPRAEPAQMATTPDDLGSGTK
ncbi:MAG TPA: hypothetical protein VFU02_03560 [Polyangiaceae bacterium]|nr:hypothetical protein [Polyangiaceae bacterium]